MPGLSVSRCLSNKKHQTFALGQRQAFRNLASPTGLVESAGTKPSLPQTRAKKIKWAMVLLFSAMGILLWIAVLLAVMVLCGIIWLFCQMMLWVMDLTQMVTHRHKATAARRNLPSARTPAASKRNVTPAPKPAAREITPDIIPKWNAGHRRYVDRDLADWQEQFDALDSGR